MKIMGCDFHPSFQQIAMVDTETGEHEEERLTPAEAVQFYSQLEGQVVVGMEASGNTLWFEWVLARLGHQVRMGDAGKIRVMEVRKQKADRSDAELLLKLLLEDRFPEVWVPSLEVRDLRQLLVHRQKLVGDLQRQQAFRTGAPQDTNDVVLLIGDIPPVEDISVKAPQEACGSQDIVRGRPRANFDVNPLARVTVPSLLLTAIAHTLTTIAADWKRFRNPRRPCSFRIFTHKRLLMLRRDFRQNRPSASQRLI